MNMGALPSAHNMVVGIVLKTTGETRKDASRIKEN